MSIHQGPFRAVQEIVLASASPRRQMLLSLLGIDFRVVPARFREPPMRPGRDPADYALEMAAEKCRTVAENNPGALILGADTIVVLDREVMGKPGSAGQGLEMLLRLQGAVHSVITGVCFMCRGKNTRLSFSTASRVEMIQAGRETLEAYMATGEPMDKAGAYAIQGAGAFLIHAVYGSYTNVVGLPLDRVLQSMLQMGAVRAVRDE